MKLQPTLIGIDPGVSNGGISALVQTKSGMKLESHKMQESFKDIKDILKPYAGAGFDTHTRCSIEKLSSRPNQNPFMNKRMEPMIINFNRIKDVLTDLNIPFQEVAPATWQKFHNLVLPKESEKGIDYEKWRELKKELKQIPKHLAIEKNIDNDFILSENVKYILNTSGREAARKSLKDAFWHFTKCDLNKQFASIEKEIAKMKAKETQVRKKRYQSRASEIAGRKVPLWESDSILLLTYENHNRCLINN